MLYSSDEIFCISFGHPNRPESDIKLRKRVDLLVWQDLRVVSDLFVCHSEVSFEISWEDFSCSPFGCELFDERSSFVMFQAGIGGFHFMLVRS